MEPKFDWTCFTEFRERLFQRETGVSKINQRGLDTDGQEAFGALLASAREDPETHRKFLQWLKTAHPEEADSYPPISRNQFARWISDCSGMFLSESALSRLERGEGRNGPTFKIVYAICEMMDFLRLPNGKRCHLREAGAILMGAINPQDLADWETTTPQSETVIPLLTDRSQLLAELRKAYGRFDLVLSALERTGFLDAASLGQPWYTEEACQPSPLALFLALAMARGNVDQVTVAAQLGLPLNRLGKVLTADRSVSLSEEEYDRIANFINHYCHSRWTVNTLKSQYINWQKNYQPAEEN